MICVEGTLRTGSYTDKKYSDVTHYTTDVLVDNAEFTGSKSDSQGGNANYSAPSNNNYNYQAPAPSQTAPASAQPAPSNDSLSFGDLGDFEEILGDGDVPF